MRRMFLIGLSLMLIGLGPDMSVAKPAYRDIGADVLGWINQTRARKGKAPVAVSRKLTRAAAAHAQDMARRGFFSHEGSDGSNVGMRVNREGYGFCLVAENIAKGQRTVNEALRGWMRSKGHRRNILQTHATEFGMVRGPGHIWVMVLGKPGC